MINVLYDLQLSMLNSLEDGEFLFTPDSNTNVATFTIKNILKNHNDIIFLILVPTPKKIAGMNASDKISKVLKKFTEDLSEFKNRIVLLPYDYFGNPFVDRMTFDSREISKVIKDYSIDLVFTNDPCKVLSYKTLLYYKQKKIFPVICRNHWVSGKLDRKVPEEIDFFIRQFEGAIYSESISFNSNYAIELFLSNAKEFFNNEVIEKVRKKCIAVETVDIGKIDKYKTDKKFDKFTISWMHRLSYYTNYENVFNAYSELYKKRKDFQMIVSDPGNKFSQDSLKKRWPFIKKINKKTWTHEKYLETCWMSDMTIGYHSYPATWGGLSITEQMAAETIPLMYNKYCYPEMFYPIFYDYVLFEDYYQMLEKTEKIIDNEIIKKQLKLTSRNFAIEKLSMNKYTEIIYNEIKKCL